MCRRQLNRADEIGQLSKAVQAMTVSLREVLKNIAGEIQCSRPLQPNSPRTLGVCPMVRGRPQKKRILSLLPPKR